MPHAGGPPKSPAVKEVVSLDGQTITIAYNSPRVHGREGKIFTKDGLISHDPHYPVWRAGANEATTLITAADLKIGALLVPKGTYTLFVDISDPAEWVLIVSKKTGEWGLAYDSTDDLGRVPLKTTAPPALVEELKYTIADLGDGKGTLTLAWENVTASVAVEIAK
jgi:hypothetical protein